MYYIGIDIAKRAHEVCFTNETGEILDGNSFNIPNTISGIDKFQKKLDKFGLTPDNSLVGMEATGHYWLVLYSWLMETVLNVKVINPLVTMPTHMLIRKVKTMASTPKWWLASKTWRSIRKRVWRTMTHWPYVSLSLQSFARQSCSDLKRKSLPCWTKSSGVEQLFSDVFGMSSRELLKTYTTPEEIASIHTTK